MLANIVLGQLEYNFNNFNKTALYLETALQNNEFEETSEELKSAWIQSFSPYGHLGVALAYLGQFDKAIHYLDKGISSQKYHDKELEVKGRCLAELGRHQEAIEIYKECQRMIDEDIPKAKNILGLMNISYNELGQHQEALNCFNKIPPIYSHHNPAFNWQKGITIDLLGRKYESAVYFEDIIDKTSQLDDYDEKLLWYIRSRAFSKMEKDTEAQECLLKSNQDWDISRNWNITRISIEEWSLPSDFWMYFNPE